MGNVLLLLAYKYRKKVQYDVPDKFENKLKQKNHPNSKNGKSSSGKMREIQNIVAKQC